MRAKNTPPVIFLTILALAIGASTSFAIEPSKPLTDPILKRWLATVRFASAPNCGGSLIDEHWVLTAKHCVQAFCGKEDSALNPLKIQVPERPLFVVKKVVCAPDAPVKDAGLSPHDVALILIQFVKEVEILPSLGQTAMAPPNAPAAPSASPTFSISRANGAQEPLDQAHFLQLFPLSRERCIELLSDPKSCKEKIPLGDNQFCAWSKEIPTKFFGLRPGDSGSPLARKAKGEPEIVGVASAACSSGLAIFEDVFFYRQWIVETACNFYDTPKYRNNCRRRILGGATLH